jgi:hypothetical protein
MDGTDSGGEHEMDKITDVAEPASELERLIAELSGSGLLVFVEVTGVRFLRGPYPFPSFPGREVLTVQFLGPDGETVLYCYVHELYDGQRMRPEKLQAWRALRERYGDRDESRVDRGTLLAPAA